MQIHTLGIDLGKTVFHVVGLNAAVYPHALRHCLTTLLFGKPLDQPGVGEACFVWSKPESEIDLDLPSTASPISNASCGGAE